MAGDQKRGLVDRVLGLARPAVVRDFTPPAREIADGLWVVARKIRLPGGIAIATTMTVMRLADGGLVPPRSTLPPRSWIYWTTSRERPTGIPRS